MATHDYSVSMDSEKGVEQQASGYSWRRPKHLKFATLVWRFLAFASTLSAFVVMITNKESTNVQVAPGVRVKVWAKYHYSDAFMWFVVANGIAFSYTLLTLLFAPFVKSPLIARILFILDLIVAFMIMSAASAATAIAHIGKHGLREANWPSICGNYNRYCDHVAGSIVASFHGWLFLTFVILAYLCQKH